MGVVDVLLGRQKPRPGIVAKDPFFGEAMLMADFNRIMDSGEMTLMQSVDLELNGGPCPVCGVAFEKRTVDNPFGRFAYYVPGLKCGCFPICDKVWHRWRDQWGVWVHGWRRGCGRHKIVETLLGVKYCLNCQTHESSAEANGRILKPKKKAEAGKESEEVVV
jgi:ssDNA-binding Zn-finger/Zn-ribbon topoisomerase 1